MKKILIMILAIAMCMAMTVTAFGDENHPPRLVDDADLLMLDEEIDLINKLDEISTRQNFDVVVVTTNDIGDKTAQEYADDYFDYNGYGMGEDDDGILLMINMGERDWAISTNSFGIVAFTDAALDYIADDVLPYISDGYYQMGFEEFADLCDAFITKAKSGDPYDVDTDPEELGALSYAVWPIPSLGAAAVIASIMKKRKKSSLKTVRMRNDASDYWSDFVLTEEEDTFLHRDIVVVKTKKNDDDNDDDNSGGSTVHKSSSGRTHGGKSGKF